MKTIACEQGLAVAMLWLAGQLTIWGIRLEIPRSSALPPVLNSRRSAGQQPAKMPLPPAAWMFTRPGGRNGRRANPCADGKGAGESAPPLRVIIYE